MAAFIYSLETLGLVWYIGHSKDPLKRYKEHLGKKTIGEVGSKLIPTEYQYEIKILEKCDYAERFFAERKWYDKLNPLYNVRAPRNYPHEIAARNRAYLERLKMASNDVRVSP